MHLDRGETEIVVVVGDVGDILLLDVDSADTATAVGEVAGVGAAGSAGNIPAEVVAIGTAVDVDVKLALKQDKRERCRCSCNPSCISIGSWGRGEMMLNKPQNIVIQHGQGVHPSHVVRRRWYPSTSQERAEKFAFLDSYLMLVHYCDGVEELAVQRAAPAPLLSLQIIRIFFPVPNPAVGQNRCPGPSQQHFPVGDLGACCGAP